MRELTLEDIKVQVCEYFGVEDIKINRRIKSDVYFRNLFYKIAYDYGIYSLKEIGKMFDKDHTTVIYGYRKITDEMTFLPDTKRHVDEIRYKIEKVREQCSTI